MSPSPKSNETAPSTPIVAGSLIVASVILCAGAGFGIGSLVGAAVLFGLAGLFVGFAVGFALVYDRFRDL